MQTCGVKTASAAPRVRFDGPMCEGWVSPDYSPRRRRDRREDPFGSVNNPLRQSENAFDRGVGFPKSYAASEVGRFNHGLESRATLKAMARNRARLFSAYARVDPRGEPRQGRRNTVCWRPVTRDKTASRMPIRAALSTPIANRSVASGGFDEGPSQRAETCRGT